MLLFYMFIILQIQTVSQYPLNMYNTNNYQNGHCFLYHSYLKDGGFMIPPGYEIIPKQEIISYCFRSTEENNSMIRFDYQNSTDPSFTFNELKEKNITSQMLLSWSASIEMAERYQIFLDNYSNSSSEKDTKFYNCTSQWFGPFCQFQLDDETSEPFEETVLSIFRLKSTDYDGVKVTCYNHLTCQTLVSCLDWREICDQKRDCLDGSDEANCWQLEMNECSESEYRCRNGQCIPIEFLLDTWVQPDCSDGTDEDQSTCDICYKTPSFEREEHTCLSGDEGFPCGDGECINEMSKCQNGRNNFLPSTFCSNATACFMELDNLVDYEWCLLNCLETNCLQDHCSMEYGFLNLPLLFGHVRFIVLKENSDLRQVSSSVYVCYDAKLCGDFLPPTAPFDNLTCRHLNDFGLSSVDLYHNQELVVNRIKNRFRGCLTIINETHYCNSSIMYQCKNSSKCISIYRLLDGVQDCTFNDDETYNESCSLKDIRHRFKCQNEDNEKCFTSSSIRNGKEECKNGYDEDEKMKIFTRTRISFQTICNGKIDLLPVLINGQNETDETECESWPCNNTYTRCDDFWLCKNGADEMDCPPTICPYHYHQCVFPNDTSKISCLPIARVGDGINDCLSVTDEQAKYRVNKDYIDDSSSLYTEPLMFHCWNDTEFIVPDKLCNNFSDCRFNDDEIFCKNIGSIDKPFCNNFKNMTSVEKLMCYISYNIKARPSSPTNFVLHDIMTYPSELVTKKIANASSSTIKIRSAERDLTDNLISDVTWWCNGGVPITVRMHDNNTPTLSCLCPPSYYGDRCQYQNQRVSLTIQIRAASDWSTMFIFLITLIDDDKNIQSHDHIEYLPIRDCKTKSSIYLLYSTRPKNSSKYYSVQIDAFNQMTWHYRASWIFPLRFPFLPVHRLAILLRLPVSNVIFVQQQCSPPCIHGQCLNYVNDRNSKFCRCETGWSGTQCDIEHKCNCAPGALCMSDLICLCPPSRFGPRCHLFQSLCHSKSCLNGGLCVSADARYNPSSTIESVCICSEGFDGNRCQHQQKRTQIDISFHSSLTIPSSLLVHLISVRIAAGEDHNRTSIAKKIQFDQHSLSLYTLSSFNIAIAQISKQYYLITVRIQKIYSAYIPTKIIPSHRCLSINELFNDTFAEIHLLKRIKYYHLPCQQHHELVCFHDDIHMCLCTLSRTANCFEFDHNMTYDCNKYNYCGNNGHCFQDDFICPTSSFCSCNQCYFGSRCQLSTKGSTLSLDTILGYHIRSKTGIGQQPIIVKISITLTTIICTFGSINSIFTFQTFRGKQTRNVGCGLYLFTSSIVSMMIVIGLALKFALFVALQIGSINSHLLLLTQCRSMDFLLRFLLSSNDWLSACVAIERAINVIQGIKFNKAKSIKTAKWMILIVLLFTSCSYIYDPLHRHLIDDKEEQHIWCLSQYSSSLQLFDWLLNIFHFCVPFAINCISAVVVIIIAARTRSNSQKTKSFKEHLREQLHHHKHLFISPMILVSLAMPRLVISFLSGCMKSAREPWSYLIGYYISFIPSVTTFIVFVLPSEMYKKEFSETMKRLW